VRAVTFYYFSSRAGPLLSRVTPLAVRARQNAQLTCHTAFVPSSTEGRVTRGMVSQKALKSSKSNQIPRFRNIAINLAWHDPVAAQRRATAFSRDASIQRTSECNE
jgi:hypothetical protein